MTGKQTGANIDKEAAELRDLGKAWRHGMGLSQEEVSTMLGLTKAVYGLFERGKSGMSKRNKVGLRRLISVDKTTTGGVIGVQKGERLRKITCGACYQDTVYSLGETVAKFCMHCGKLLK